MGFARKGEILWRLGAEVDYFGVVATGFVKLNRPTKSGQEVTTEIMGPGHVFGLLGTIDGTGCPQSARAVTDVWFLKVRKVEFMPVYDESLVLKDRLLMRTTVRLRQTHDMITHLSSSKVEERIAAVLLVLADSFGKEVAGGVILDVPLARLDIAEIAGTTVETTIRIMSSWQKKGWVRTQSKRISLRDIQALINVVEG